MIFSICNNNVNINDLFAIFQKKLIIYFGGRLYKDNQLNYYYFVISLLLNLISGNKEYYHE
ncbi:hypothetical protein PR729_20105 [Providencia rettgeri]|nr:hypothetical protein PR729_20105 [Providencia rettgeri]